MQRTVAKHIRRLSWELQQGRCMQSITCIHQCIAKMVNMHLCMHACIQQRQRLARTDVHHSRQKKQRLRRQNLAAALHNAASRAVCYSRSLRPWRRRYQRPSTPTMGCCCRLPACTLAVARTWAALAVQPRSIRALGRPSVAHKGVFSD